MSTYTIIVSHEMLIGTVLDGEDVSASTAAALAEADLEQDETLYTESGLTLTAPGNGTLLSGSLHESMPHGWPWKSPTSSGANLQAAHHSP